MSDETHDAYIAAFEVAGRQRDTAMAQALADFYKRRAEIEADFAAALVKAGSRV